MQSCFEAGELDFVFIDGEHGYEAAKADVEAWWPKVRSGGLLVGHDYDRHRFPGVCRAVDEFGEKNAGEVERCDHSVWCLSKSNRNMKKQHPAWIRDGALWHQNGRLTEARTSLYGVCVVGQPVKRYRRMPAAMMFQA